MDRVESAEELKQLANEKFNKSDYKEAIKLYSKAIEKSNSDGNKLAIYYSNRSIAQMKIGKYLYALSDAEKAKEYDPYYVKAYYRRAMALFFMNRINESIKELLFITKTLKIKNKQIDKQVQSLKRLRKERGFSEALNYQFDIDSFDEQQIYVEESYDGPIIEQDTEITFDFVLTIIEYLRNQKQLHKRYLWVILKRTQKLLDKYENVVDIDFEMNNQTQITVCGDVHGQYYDFINIFKLNSHPTPEKPYLFNGDFVDRGPWSIEIVIVLFLFKLYNPNCIYLNRGNHEDFLINRKDGFEGEMKAKYCERSFRLISEVFKYLPLAHRINKKVLVLHGGLFNKEGVTIEDIQKLNRKQDVPQEGLMCDLLWSDPTNEDGIHVSGRGLGVDFGPDVAKRFLDNNNLGKLKRITSKVP